MKELVYELQILKLRVILPGTVQQVLCSCLSCLHYNKYNVRALSCLQYNKYNARALSCLHYNKYNARALSCLHYNKYNARAVSCLHSSVIVIL